MAIRRFLETHGVFSIREFDREFPASVTDRNLLTRAVSRGAVQRVRRGLYVSRVGRFDGVAPEPLDVAVCAADGLVFCGMTALRLHGVAHNLAEQTHFYVPCGMKGFAFDGHEYVPHLLRGRRVEQVMVMSPGGRSYPVTTEAQTIVDCAANLRLGGGIENVLRSIAGFGFTDVDGVVRCAQSESASTRARLGWILEHKSAQWNVTAEQLAALAAGMGRGPFYFTSARPPRDTHWVGRWRLYLPVGEQEMDSWLNG